MRFTSMSEWPLSAKYRFKSSELPRSSIVTWKV